MGRIAPLHRFMESRRFIEPNRQDPYRTQAKLKGTPQCPTCHAFSIQGRWIQEDKAAPLLLKSRSRDIQSQRYVLCPSCREQQEKYAASVVELHGSAWQEKSDQLFQTLRRTEEIARARNDQERILWIENDSDRGVTRIFVSLPELARQMGQVLRQTFKGHAAFHRSTEEPFLRVIWTLDPQKFAPLSKSKHWRNRGSQRT